MRNILHTGGRYITTHCNSRERRVTKEAALKGCGTVWFYKCAISSIPSFGVIKEKYPVPYDTEGNYFYIVKTYKEVLLQQIPSGLYFHNTYNQYMVLINTILDIRGVFSQRQSDGAKQV